MTPSRICMKEPGWDHRVPSGLFAARSAVPLRVGLRPGPLEDETQEGLHRGGLLLIPAIGHIDGALVEAVLQVKELHLALSSTSVLATMDTPKPLATREEMLASPVALQNT